MLVNQISIYGVLGVVISLAVLATLFILTTREPHLADEINEGGGLLSCVVRGIVILAVIAFVVSFWTALAPIILSISQRVLA